MPVSLEGASSERVCYVGNVPDTDSVIIVKRFTYRGALEEWSNRYHLEGTTPTTPTTWKALYDAIIASEKAVYPANHSVVRAYGYVAGNDNAVDVVDYTVSPLSPVAGTLTMATNYVRAPGDAAVTLRWGTPDFARGKRVYLRKYFHGAVNDSSVNQDAVASGQVTAMTAHGAKMYDGTLPGGMKVCGPQGADAISHAASAFITTRTLKRRGKRPPTAP